MCLVKKDLKMMTADHDMIVYKLLFHTDDGRMYTPYMHSNTSIGDKIVSCLKPCSSIGKWYVEGEGVHAYTDVSVAISQCDVFNHHGVDSLGRMCGMKGRTVVCESVIPADESFFIGSEDDIASGSLVIGNIVYDGYNEI